MGEPGNQFEAFDSKQACEAYKTNELKDARKKLEGAPAGIELQPAETANIKWIYFLGVLHDECIATDDPRLKEK